MDSLPPTEGAAAERAGRALILASFLSSLGFSFVFPLLPLYVKEVAGDAGAAMVALWAGFALAATPLGGALASPYWGRLADRIGHRPMLLRALLCTTATIGLMALPNAPWQLVVLRGLTGVLGSFQAAAMAAMASWSRREDLSKAVSRLQMASVFGSMVGPLVGGGVAAFFGVRVACVAGGAVIGFGTILVARWFHEPARRHARLREAPAPFRPAILWLPMLTLVAIQFTDSSFNPILPLLLVQGGVEAGTVAGLAGLAASLNATAAAGGAALAGRWFRRGVGYRTMMAAVVTLGLLALSAAAAPTPWGLIAARILCGGTVAGAAVAAYSMGGLVPASQRGAAYGWLASAGMGGYAASPIVAGSLAAVELRAVLAVDMALCLIAAAGWGRSRGIARTETPSVRPASSLQPREPVAALSSAVVPPASPEGPATASGEETLANQSASPDRVDPTDRSTANTYT